MQLPHFRLLLTLAGLTLAAACGAPQESDTPSALAGLEQPALGESLNTSPTGWWWYYGQTPSQVSALLSANGARLVSLQVEQESPLLLTVAMVRNSGTHAKTWWWYYGVTASQLSSSISANNARIVNLEPYVVDGQTLFAAVLISNTGAEAKGWWWYHGLTSSQVSSYLQQNGARLVDLNAYTVSGSTRYAVVMIPNSGQDARAWWYYYGVTGSQLATLLQQNSAFLTNIDPADSSGSTFNVIMERTSGFLWWWYYGLSASQLGDRLAQNGARLLEVKTYYSGGLRRFAAVMVNNSNAATSRVGEILRDGTDGATGLYLKQVGGLVQANLQEDRVFEPASTIKALIALNAMRRVDAGQASLTQLVSVYQPSSGSCPTSTITGTEPLGDALRLMLVNSDNQRTRALIDAVGFNAINQTAQAAGMVSTQLNHYPGCGGPVPNRLTLEDAGRLYEGIENGTLLSATSRAALYARMPAQGGDSSGVESAADLIVDQEAASLGLTTTQAQAFKSRLRTRYKGGSYTLCSSSSCLQYRSVAGSAAVPWCSSGAVSSRSYVFGIFIDGATSATAANNTFHAAKAETLREPIRASLSTWDSCSP
jgi:hypothetical protein